MERLIEQFALVAPVDEDGVKRPVEVAAVADADGLDRFQRLQHLARPDRHAGDAQAAGEMHDVGRQPAAVDLDISGVLDHAGVRGDG